MGNPVAGAVVFQSGDGPSRTHTRSDDEGRFRLDGVDDGPAFVFARKPGFRFHGQLVETAAGPVTLTLMQTGEKPAVAMRTRPSPLPHLEELALARRVIDAYADKVLKEGDMGDKLQTLEALAQVEPERVLAEARKGKFPDPLLNDEFRMQVVAGMSHEDPEAAAKVAETIRSPMFRSLAYARVSQAFGPSPEHWARRVELLDQALLHARGVKDGDKRLACLGRVADQLLELGEMVRATKVLREGEKVARELPAAGYARAAFAEELAQIDLDAALALTRDLSDPDEFDRHHGNIAHELASQDPAAAERILAMVRDQRQREYYAIRVCYRMAPIDLLRARRIAGGIRHTLMKPYSLGVMAQALAGSEQTRPVAAELLAAAFDELARSVDAGTDPFNSRESAAVTAASLLPVAEAIDPALVPEYLWRSVSFRRPGPGPESHPSQGRRLDASAAVLAMRIARYDPATAGALLEPVAQRARSRSERDRWLGRPRDHRHPGAGQPAEGRQAARTALLWPAKGAPAPDHGLGPAGPRRRARAPGRSAVEVSSVELFSYLGSGRRGHGRAVLNAVIMVAGLPNDGRDPVQCIRAPESPIQHVSEDRTSLR